MTNSFTKNTSWLWQNAEKLLIILFLATFTLNIRKVFLTPYSFLNGTFNEYMTMSFSWADALMIAVILIYTIKYVLRQSKCSSSILRETSQGETIKENKKGYLSSIFPIHNISRETYLLFFFVAWCFFSIAWSSYKPIASYRCLTLLEIILFFAIAYRNLVANDRLFRISFIALIINGLFQSIVAILQFIYGHSLGLRFLGESIVSRETLGVAKIMINGAKHIRAYGTFPHPNILAGFLIISLAILSMSLIIKWRLKRSQTNLLSDGENESKIVSRATILSQMSASVNILILVVVGLAFVLTFSRSAFLGFFVIMLFIFYKIIPGSKHRQIILASSLFIIIILFGFLYSVNRNTSIFSDQSIRERTSYVNVSREIISEHPLAGVGMGQFVLSEYNKNSTLEGWQYQPVHNIILMIFSELGIVGLVFFLLWIFVILEWGIGNTRNTELLLTTNKLCCIIFAFLPIFLFDHYFWDIKTGIVIFSLAVFFAFLGNQDSTKIRFIE